MCGNVMKRMQDKNKVVKKRDYMCQCRPGNKDGKWGNEDHNLL